LEDLIKSVKLEAQISHIYGLMYKCLYRRILEFYSIVGSPTCRGSATDDIWIVLCFESYLGVGGIWPLPVLIGWILWSMSHVVILIPFRWTLACVGLLADPEQLAF
jgi:hypothetical protein